MVRTRDRVSTRFLNRGETRSSCLTVLEPTTPTDGVAWRVVRQAELAASGVISHSLLASLRDPFPGWLCPPQFKLGIGDDWEGPFAEIGFEMTVKQDDSGQTAQVTQMLAGFNWR